MVSPSTDPTLHLNEEISESQSERFGGTSDSMTISQERQPVRNPRRRTSYSVKFMRTPISTNTEVQTRIRCETHETKLINGKTARRSSSPPPALISEPYLVEHSVEENSNSDNEIDGNRLANETKGDREAREDNSDETTSILHWFREKNSSSSRNKGVQNKNRREERDTSSAFDTLEDSPRMKISTIPTKTSLCEDKPEGSQCSASARANTGKFQNFVDTTNTRKYATESNEMRCLQEMSNAVVQELRKKFERRAFVRDLKLCLLRIQRPRPIALTYQDECNLALQAITKRSLMQDISGRYGATSTSCQKRPNGFVSIEDSKSDATYQHRRTNAVIHELTRTFVVRETAEHARAQQAAHTRYKGVVQQIVKRFVMKELTRMHSAKLRHHENWVIMHGEMAQKRIIQEMDGTDDHKVNGDTSNQKENRIFETRGIGAATGKEYQATFSDVIQEIMNTSVESQFNVKSACMPEHRCDCSVVQGNMKRDVINELTCVLASKNAQRQKADLVLYELVKKFVIYELKKRIEDIQEMRMNSNVVIQELTKKFVLQEVTELLSALKVSHAAYDDVLQELVKRWVIQEIMERSTEMKKLHEKSGAVIQEVLKRSLLKELNTRSLAIQKFQVDFAEVMRELSWRSIFQELSDRSKERQLLHQTTKAVFDNLTMRFELDKAKQRTMERQRLREKYNAVFQELRRKVVARELNDRCRALDDFKTKSNLVLQEMKDRWDFMEIQEFQQLVIQDLFDRSEALELYHERLNLVLVELAKKFVLTELKRRSSSMNELKQKAAEVILELHDRLDWEIVPDRYGGCSASSSEWLEIHDRSEWVVCDDFGEIPDFVY